MTVDFTAAGISLPSHAAKRRLLPPARRARAALRVANQFGVDVLALFELEDRDRRRIARLPRWAVGGAKPNTATRRKTIRNGIATREPFYRMGRIRSLATWVIDRSRRRTLHMAEATIGHRDHGRLYTQIAAHQIRKRLDPAGNRRGLRRVAKRCRRLNARRRRPVVTMDANISAAVVAEHLEPAGMRLAVADGVDQTWIGDDVELVDGDVVTAQVRGRVSDHPLVVAHLRVTVPAPTRRAR